MSTTCSITSLAITTSYDAEAAGQGAAPASQIGVAAARAHALGRDRGHVKPVHPRDSSGFVQRRGDAAEAADVGAPFERSMRADDLGNALDAMAMRLELAVVLALVERGRVPGGVGIGDLHQTRAMITGGRPRS